MGQHETKQAIMDAALISVDIKPSHTFGVSSSRRWVGCLADSSSSAKCSFVDGEGHLMWQGRMILLSGKEIHDLSIRPGEEAFSVKWSRKEDRPIWIVHLTDGDSLVPPDNVDEMRANAD